MKPNEIVRVRFLDPTAAAPVAKSVRIELARADGYVTAVNGTSFTVIGRDGFARTGPGEQHDRLPGRGRSGEPAEVRVGTLVRAEGNLDANGTTLNATRIGTRMPPRLRPGAGTGPASGTGSTTG